VSPGGGQAAGAAPAAKPAGPLDEIDEPAQTAGKELVEKAVQADRDAAVFKAALLKYTSLAFGVLTPM
jgi:hypothetical protein